MTLTLSIIAKFPLNNLKIANRFGLKQNLNYQIGQAFKRNRISNLLLDPLNHILPLPQLHYNFFSPQMSSIIESLTQNQPSNARQLTLSSTLPSKIYRIECLQKFHSLKKLNLSNNCIQKIENLSHLSQLKVLNLQFNQLSVLQNLETLINLEELLLSYNSIEFISPKIELNQKLKVLNLGFNEIKTIDMLMPIFSLQKLVVLFLHGNPFINTLNYMVFVKLLMPDLLFLDEKDLNNTNVESELYPQEEVAILRDTLNKLLQERNYLAQELQNLTSISSPTKINLKEYLKSHQQNSKIYKQQQNSFSNSNAKIATFSPFKDGSDHNHKEPIFFNKNQNKSKLNRSINQDESSINIIENFEARNNAKGSNSNQRQKMIEILKYWLTKLEDKISTKKIEVSQLHEYYTNKLTQKRSIINNRSSEAYRENFESQNDERPFFKDNNMSNVFQTIDKINSKQILKEIKQKQSELNSYKLNSKAIKNLVKEIEILDPSEEMYKTIMMRILFGSKVMSNSDNNNDEKKSKKQLNYRELKHFLLSEYGLLNAVNDLNKLVFGTSQFNIEKVNQLRSWTGNKSLLVIVNEAKSQLKQLKKQKKQFQKQKQQYLKKLQRQTKQLCDQWGEFNQNKKQFDFQKGKQFRYQQKLLQQRQTQIEDKFQELKISEQRKLQSLQKQKIQYENEISEFSEKLQQLQEKYERRFLELEQFQKQFNTFKEDKLNMAKMQEQVKKINKQLFQKENIMAQTNQKLKQLSLNEEINSERMKFLERKCYEKSEEIKMLDQEEKNLKKKVKQLTQEEKLKTMELNGIKEMIAQMNEEEKNIAKNIERHRSNLILYEQKLKNLSELQSHKKKSIQDLELRIQQEKAEYIHLKEKNLQLEEILAQKQENVHSYQLKISQHKKSLQSYTDISRNIQQLMDRQSQLKKSILQLQIENGNLMDLKSQLVRELKQNENFSAFKARNDWKI